MPKKITLSKDVICPNCQVKNNSQIKFNISGYDLWICQSCANGFVHPVPAEMTQFYPDNYWMAPGFLGKIKTRVYDFFQQRRVDWVRKYIKKGQVLDVGAGEGLFAEKITGEIKVSSIDFPGAGIKNPQVLGVDFLAWDSKQKFDGIVYWESLEHVSSPAGYLAKSLKILNNRGVVVIECPDFGSLEARLFGRNWYHLDPPRHLVHLTSSGLRKILQDQGFEVVQQRGVFAPEYMYAGLTVSLLKSFGIDAMGIYLKKGNLFKLAMLVILLSPVLITGFMAETFLCFFGQSPIMLTVARKINK